MSGLTPNDKENLTYVECPDGTYSQQVTIKDDASVDPTDVPIMQCLEDANGDTFFATYLIDPSDGSVSGGPIYTDAEGNAFTPVAPITKPVKVFDSEIKLFCDSTDTKYFKILVFDEDGDVTSVTDVDLNGVAYNPVGDEELCENENEDIRVFTEVLCDSGANNKPYLACYTKNLTSNTNTLLTYELDGTTAYNPVTPGVYKPIDQEIIKLFVYEKGSNPQGATEHYWFNDGANGNAVGPFSSSNGGPPITEIFTEQDNCGLLQHENPEDSVSVVPVFGTSDNANPNTVEQGYVDGWVYVPAGGAQLIARVNGFSSYAVYFGGCNEKLILVEDGVNNTASLTTFYNVDLNTLPSGFYHIRAYVNDPGTRGRIEIQWDLDDGNGIVAIPQDNIFATKPIINQIVACVDKDTGTIRDLDGVVIDDTNYLYSPCDLCGINELFGNPEPEPIKPFDVIQAYKADLSGIANGVNERYWEDTAYQNTGGAGNTPNQFDLAFDATDECNLPDRTGVEDIANVIATDGGSTTENPDGSTSHQSIAETYIVVPEGGAVIRFNNTGNADYAAYAGRCGTKPTLVGTGSNTNTDIETTLSQGFYKLVYYVNDAGTNGRARVQWSIGGANFVDIPADELYTEEPTADCTYVRVCKETGDITALNGDDLPADTSIYFCNPCAETANAVASGAEPLPTFNTERVCVTQENTLSATVDVLAGTAGVLQWQTNNASTQQDPIYRYQVDTGAGRVFTDRSDTVDLSKCPDGEYAFNYSIIMRSGYVYTSFRGTHYTVTNGVITGVTNGSFSINETYRYKVREAVAVYNCDGTVKGYYRIDGTEDVLAAGEEYSIDCPDNPSYIPDVATPKAVQENCVLREIYVADGGTVGFGREYWEASALDPGPTGTVAEAFTIVDECGKLQHINAPDTTAPVEAYPADGARTFDNNTAGIAHQARTSGFICVPSGGKSIKVLKTGAHASLLYLGPCNGKEVPVIESEVSETGVVGCVDLFEGIYKFTLYAHDDGTTGSSRLRWSNLDGSSLQNIPATEIYEVKPNVSKVFAWITKGEDEAVGLDNVRYDLIDDKVFLCDPLNGDVGEGINILNTLSNSGKDSASIVGNERIVLNPIGPNSSSLTVPASANGAVIQVQIKDENERSKCITWYADGRTPNATQGLQAGHKEYIYLGCAASNNATVSDDPQELVNFIINTGEIAAGNVCAEVIYYAF